jgi:hypothetical protein
MPQLSTVVSEASYNGVTYRRSVPVSTDGGLVKNPELAVAKVGALTTRTDDNTGELTMASGHGISTGNRLDVYWTNADGTQGRRYGMTVGTVASLAVPIDGGAGDNLPADETAVTAMVPQLETFAVTAADMEALFVGCGGPATAVFREADTTLVIAVGVDGPTDAYLWESTNGAATPFGENVADVYLSHGDSSTAWPVNVAALIN